MLAFWCFTYEKTSSETQTLGKLFTVIRGQSRPFMPEKVIDAIRENFTYSPKSTLTASRDLVSPKRTHRRKGFREAVEGPFGLLNR